MSTPRAFEVTALSQSSILYLYSIRDKVDLDPHYQREGDVWSPFKRQLLMDSIINGFDIPKIYFHDLGPSAQRRYAVVDGKQRLQAIWSFLEDGFALADDFVLFSDPHLKLGGLKYSDLARKHPQLKIKLDATSLSVVRVETDDLDFIEEMFSRLNEAVPLSSAEKRRTFGGPAAKLINSLTSHNFFQARLGFRDHRARYFDVATKLLYLEAVGSIADTKREFLDLFVREMRTDDRLLANVEAAAARVVAVLNRLSAIFVEKDPLLKQVGLITVYYWLVRSCVLASAVIERSDFERFEAKREQLRKGFTADSSSFDDAAIYQFNKLSQTPNDSYAIEFRVAVLVDNLVAQEKKKAVTDIALRYAMIESMPNETEEAVGPLPLA